MPHYASPEPIPFLRVQFAEGEAAAALLAQGWTELPPQPTPDSTWNGDQWNTPRPPEPDYIGLKAALLDSPLMDRAINRQTPTLILSPAGAGRTTGEIYTALNRINDVYAIERTTRRFMAILDRFANEGDLGNATFITRFQARSDEWVLAVNFNTEDRTTLRMYFEQFAPGRGYLIP